MKIYHPRVIRSTEKIYIWSVSNGVEDNSSSEFGMKGSSTRMGNHNKNICFTDPFDIF